MQQDQPSRRLAEVVYAGDGLLAAVATLVQVDRAELVRTADPVDLVRDGLLVGVDALPGAGGGDPSGLVRPGAGRSGPGGDEGGGGQISRGGPRDEFGGGRAQGGERRPASGGGGGGSSRGNYDLDDDIPF